MKSCRTCAAKAAARVKKADKKKSAALVAARAAEKRAAADANPDVLDVERSKCERRLIVSEILSHELFRQLPAHATVHGTTRFAVGEVSWAKVQKKLWREAAMTMTRRGGSSPSLLHNLLHENGTTFGEIELRRAGAQVWSYTLPERSRRGRHWQHRIRRGRR